jgi:adenosylcobinamide-phosphate synthase
MMPSNRRWWVAALALLVDSIAGDLPNRWHPVAWMGSAINAARKHAPTSGAGAQFAYGAAVTLMGAITAAAVGYLASRLCARLPRPFGLLVEATLLKQTIAMRGLSSAAYQVYAPLSSDAIAEARHQLGWHLVSRDTTTLDAPRIAAATLESVAENSSDGIVAPLCYYALGALPGAFAYRWLNTVDSLWGYRDPAREWLGKAGARGDDAANWLPARISALLLVIGAVLFGTQRQAWRIWQRDARLTASPNAGHPMSAMAGALGVELEKVGHYQLGAGLALPQAADIPRAITLMRAAMLAGMTISGLILLVIKAAPSVRA